MTTRIEEINQHFATNGIRGRLAGYRTNQFGELEIALVANGQGPLAADLDAMGDSDYVLSTIRQGFPFQAAEVVPRPNNERTWADVLTEQSDWVQL